MIRSVPSVHFLALLTSVSCISPAVAQESAPKSASSSGSEDIVVTADRLTDTSIGKDTAFGILGERAIIDTLFSVTSFTEALIRNTGARSLSDLLVRDPSVSADVNAAGFRDAFSIRGFAVGRGAFLYDGIAGLTPGDGYISLSNLERVEIFRGANAFVAGASAFGGVGGAINLVPKRPANAPVNEVTVGYQSDSPLVAVDFSRRFGANDQFGARFTGYYQSGDGPVDQLRRRTENYALYLDWQATETLYFATEVNRFRDRSDGYRDDVYLNPGVTVPEVPDLKRNYLQPWTFIEQSGVRVVAQAKWNFVPGWTLSGGYGEIYGDRDNGYYSAFGQVTNNAGDIESFPFRSYQPQNDVQAGQILLNGKFDFGGIKSDVTLGYSRTSDNSPGTGVGADTIFTNLYTPVYVIEPAVPPSEALPVEGLKTSVRSLIAMYQAKLWDDRLSILGGVRDVAIKVDASFTQYDDSKLSPFGAVSFKPTSSSLLYASYTQGLERGGTAPIAAVNAGDVLSPGVTEQYELGGKIELGKLIATAAIFEISRPLEFLNSANVFVQDGRQVHRGAELQVQGNIASNLRAITGVTYLDASIDNGNPALQGNRPLGVPEWSATFFLDHDVAALPGLSVNGGVIVEGSQFADLANTQRVNGWTRFDLGARYKIKVDDAEITARFNVDNLFNEGYWGVNASGGLLLSSPRVFRVSLSAGF